jgi:hypothetical protein
VRVLCEFFVTDFGLFAWAFIGMAIFMLVAPFFVGGSDV